MLKFTTQTMLHITNILEEKVDMLKAKEIIAFEVINPDIETSLYGGNSIVHEDISYIYRGYKSWIDLAHILKCKMLTPMLTCGNIVRIRYEKLNEDVSFHLNTDGPEFKYGNSSIFSKIYKMEEPAFLHYYKQALKNVHINKRIRILNLGVNSGDEFEFIKEYATNFSNLELVGIDYCDSAIEDARKKFLTCGNVSFYTHDINDLASLNLGTFDLIISIGTLQSSNLEFNPLFMSLVQKQLKKDGAMILGFPNCRWLDGEMIYGARVKHYPFSEMSVMYKDAIFCKKYLQQKKFRVTLTGKEYIFLTATSIRKENI
ncbi:methyltransferase domain-containing protein [Sulfurimonas sp. SAG-AH-194-I05]|nr:class I SAM-dependent methyltransferase [Sulfurimonas sp. SAG-AH-194-I05]MDF1875786.1 methyltransferase domain-containing protein [Sulfurimonas sp. SAG-AH-194-I05]